MIFKMDNKTIQFDLLTTMVKKCHKFRVSGMIFYLCRNLNKKDETEKVIIAYLEVKCSFTYFLYTVGCNNKYSRVCNG